jgi:hypothetical protein
MRFAGKMGAVDDGLATQIRTAFNGRDLDALRELLAENATWGEDPYGESFCNGRDDIIHRVKHLLASGVRATIIETAAGPRGIAARVEVEWPKGEDPGGRPFVYPQAYVVVDGLVAEIHGHDDFASAVAAISH